MCFRKTLTFAVILHGGVICAAPNWTVVVNPHVEIGPIKRMNAVNNGPTKPRSEQCSGNFDEYKALKIPYARLHDSALCTSYGGSHAVDVSGVFPRFEADESDPANYDFTLTDEYVGNIRASGTEPYYRLGQSIEHWIKKYGVNPPKDFSKWARICEHIVRHYNEGWAGGHKWGIKYWEIWNEPDGNKPTADGRPGPTWTGTMEQFLELYRITSTHLRKCFGDSIKIGGPAFCSWNAWEKDFLPFCAKNRLPLDFYSWHRYFADPETLAEEARRARKLLDDNGFANTESHLNEWNYVRGWTDEWGYTLECEAGRFNQKCAAAMASAMIACQNAPVDMLMFYDARVSCGMNSMFNRVTLRPMKGYYPFVAWRRLVETGLQVEAVCETPDIAKRQLYACAAKGKDGKLVLFIARYSDDNNVVDIRRVRIVTPASIDVAAARCHLTASDYTYTEMPLLIVEGGKAEVKLEPNSFALIEF